MCAANILVPEMKRGSNSNMRDYWNNFRALAGADQPRTGLADGGLSLLGGVLGIAAVMWLTPLFVPGEESVLLVASMGATAVLVFGVPHVPLAQPWPLLGGHFVSALVGISVAQSIADPLLAGPLAVGLAIFAMHLLGCIHPPGGATALSAVVSGPAVLALGFDYLWTPVMLNALIILSAALLVNAPFSKRRYPAYLARRSALGHGKASSRPLFSNEDITYALRGMDGFMDVSEPELQELFELARRHARGSALRSGQIQPGAFYSNGELGERWQVREVLEIGGSGDQEQVIYKVRAGIDLYSTDVMSRPCFARWARQRVKQADGRDAESSSAWVPVDEP